MAEQAGRVALVTGANTGIGFEAALQLAPRAPMCCWVAVISAG